MSNPAHSRVAYDARRRPWDRARTEAGRRIEPTVDATAERRLSFAPRTLSTPTISKAWPGAAVLDGRSPHAIAAFRDRGSAPCRWQMVISILSSLSYDGRLSLAPLASLDAGSIN